MRRIAWAFALFGVTGLAGRTLSAAEPTAAPATAPRARLSQAPKTPAAAPETPRTRQLKNYADELFGPEAAEADEGKVTVRSAAPKAVAAKPAASTVAEKPEPESKPLAKKAAPKTPGADWSLATDEKDPFDSVMERQPSERDEAEAVIGRKTASNLSFAPKAKETPAAAAKSPFAEESEPAADEAPAATKSAVVPVAGEAAPWAKTRVQAAEYDHPTSEPEARRVAPVSAARTAAATPAAPPATRNAVTGNTAAAKRLSAPIDIEPAQEVAADEAEPDVVPARKSGLTFTRTPAADRSRTPVAAPAAESKFRPDAAAPAARPATFAATPAAAHAVEPAPLAPAKADVAVPNVTATWRNTGSIIIGQECTCQLVVKNHGGVSASDVAVEATFPKNVRIISAEPKPTSQAGFLGWGFDSLAAGEETVITVKLVPTQRGQIETDARVRFSNSAKNSFTVAEPMLALKVEGPKEVLVGDPAAHNVLITNPGTGVATNVKIEAVIPKGLEHIKGERLVMDLGSLNPGETRNIRLACAAVTSGNHKIQVRAIADADLNETAASEVTVIAPQVQAAIEGPGLRYLGRNGVFHLHVTNDGSVATENVRVLHKIPEGFDFVSAGNGATHDATNRLLSWYVGHLEPGQKADLEVTLVAAKAGEFTHYIRATSESGAVNDSSLATRVEGSPALVLSIRDLDDPVEVGVETAYEIKVKNEGSAAASNVGLTLELPQGVAFLEATGPGDHATEKGLVTFRPVGELGPGKSLTFMLKVKGQVSGNARLRSKLTSDSIEEPIVADEQTKFYQ